MGKALVFLFSILLTSQGLLAAGSLCSESLFFSPAEKMLNQKMSPLDIEFKTVESGREALASMVQMIRNAEKSIDCSSYILRADESGYLLLNEFRKAMARGVRIRILVDSLGSRSWTHAELIALMKEAKKYEAQFGPDQVQVATFNSLIHVSRSWKTIVAWISQWLGKASENQEMFKSVLNRLHDKVLIVDAETPNMLLMTGGRNIGNAYFDVIGSGKDKRSYLDFSVIIRPKAAAQKKFGETLETYFESLFFHQTNKFLTDKIFRIFPVGSGEVQKMIDSLDQQVWLEEKLSQMSAEQYFETNFENASAKFVHELTNVVTSNQLFNDQSIQWKSGLNRNSIMKSIKSAMAQAQQRIRIVTPYLVLTKSELDLIYSLLISKPDLQVELFTNSIQTTDQAASQLIFEQLVVPELLKIKADPRVGDRLRAYVYRPSASEVFGGQLHTKLVQVDNELLVTSSNFDVTSRLSNSEMGFWISPKDSPRTQEDHFREVKERSVEWGSADWQKMESSKANSKWRSLKKYLATFLIWLHIDLLKI